MNDEGLIHKIEPFDTDYQYIADLKRCGGGEPCPTRDQHQTDVLATDTSFCPDPPEDFDPPYDPNVNNITESLRVLDDPNTFSDRHWAYAAFYEWEGWTEAKATEIKGVRCLFPAPPQALLAGSI